MKLTLLILSALFAYSLHAQTSYVPSTQLLKKKGYQFNIGGDYFKTTKPLDQDGTGVAFTDGNKFSRIQSEVSGYYGATSELQVGFGVRYRKNSATVIDSSNVQTNPSSAGVESSFLSLKYAFKPVDQLQYTLEGLFRYRPFTNEEMDAASNPENMILGDDGNEYSGGLGVTYASKGNNYLTVRGGFRKPGTELSSEIYWNAEGALAWKHVALIAGVDGNSSLKKDPYTSKPTEKPQFNTGNTQLYHGINREWMTPYAGINIAMGNDWRVEFRGSQVISGRSTDIGTGFSFQLIRRVDKIDTARVADRKFKTYDVEATITKISPKKAYVVVDKGLSDDISKGMIFDFFDFDYLGGNALVARGVVIETKVDSSIVKITQRYDSKKEIKAGLIGRSYQK